MVKNIDLIGENTGKIRGKIYNLYHIKELYLSLINAHADEKNFDHATPLICFDS